MTMQTIPMPHCIRMAKGYIAPSTASSTCRAQASTYGNAQEPVFAPTIGSRSGLVVREVAPSCMQSKR